MSYDYKKSRATKGGSTQKESVMTTILTHDKGSKIFDNQQDVEDLIPCQSCLFRDGCEVNLKDCVL